MPATVLVGCQWGDEGKGKIIDLLTPRYDWVVRYQGGPNAGHTVRDEHGNTYIFHAFPSGLRYPHVKNAIGNGVADLSEMREEMKTLSSRGIKITPDNLCISTNVHVIMSHHIERDKLRSAKKIGTTERGIGPAYEDKAARTGIKFGDLYFLGYPGVRSEVLDRLERNGYENPNEVLSQLEKDFEQFKPFVRDTVEDLNDALKRRDRVLCEGAQGTFLDVDMGTYPFVTSSNTTAGGAMTGLGISPRYVKEVIGLVKAYTTRVGNGPFPTEFKLETGERYRKVGVEVGTTTGRPRRCGALDIPMLRRSAEINGLTSIALTKLDVLDQEKGIPVCTRYFLDGAMLDRMPSHYSQLEHCIPQFEILTGWQEKTDNIRKIADLPENAKKYVKKIEKELHTPVFVVGVGSRRQEIAVR